MKIKPLKNSRKNLLKLNVMFFLFIFAFAGFVSASEIKTIVNNGNVVFDARNSPLDSTPHGYLIKGGTNYVKNNGELPVLIYDFSSLNDEDYIIRVSGLDNKDKLCIRSRSLATYECHSHIYYRYCSTCIGDEGNDNSLLYTSDRVVIGFYKSNQAVSSNLPIKEVPLKDFIKGYEVPEGTKYAYVYFKDTEYYDNGYHDNFEIDFDFEIYYLGSSECSVSADCGINSYIGDKFCSNGNVYQKYQEFGCLNPGTLESSCFDWSYDKLIQTCSYGCLNGKCNSPKKCSDGIDNDGDGLVDMNDSGCESLNDDDEIDCYMNTDCGNDECAGGQNYCKDNDVYQNFRFFTCNNPGLNNAFCSDEIFPYKIFECSDDYCEAYGNNYCSNGDVYHKKTCYDKGCSNAECFSVSFQDAKIVKDCLYGCLDGDCLISDCKDNDNDGYDTCNLGEIGDDGKIADCNDNNADVHPNALEVCNGIDDDCDGLIDEGEVCVTECNDNIDNDDDDLIDEQDPGCWDDIGNPLTYNPDLDDESRADSICCENGDCGKDDYVGENYCKNNDVAIDFKSFICNNPGLGTSECISLLTQFLVDDCGNDYCEAYGNNYCSNGDVYHKKTCYDKGCSNAECFSVSSDDEELVEECKYGCKNGECKDKPNYDDESSCIFPEECGNQPYQEDNVQESSEYFYSDKVVSEESIQKLGVSNDSADGKPKLSGIWIFVLIILIIILLIFIIASLLFR